MTTRHVHVRATRDRVIDLLGLGETYPLQDVAVEQDQLTVSFQQPTSFGIEPIQRDVRYELYDDDHHPVDPPCWLDGSRDDTRDDTRLPGPIVTADRTFRIHAVKLATGHDDFLAQTASVKVGLNTQLRAYLPDLPRLSDDAGDPMDSDPRIADHGASVRVIVEGTQAEASYQLVYAGPDGTEIITAPVPSTGGALALVTRPVEEDTRIRIRATRMSGPPDTALLAPVLPLAVRADPLRPVAIDGGAIVDPAAATLVIGASQASVLYTAHVRTLRDHDFVDGAPPGESVFTVAVPAALDAPAHDVQVRMPALPVPWQVVQDDFSPRGATTPGSISGGEIRILLGALGEDSVLVIQAHKDHFAADAGPQPVRSGRSDVQLTTPLVALARPDAAPALTFTLQPSDEGAGSALLVSGGQRGVFYHLRATASGPELGLPAYVHRLDDDDPEQNRGIGQLAIQYDLALARASASAVLPSPELVRPPDPLVDVAPVPGAAIDVHAVASRTGIPWPASRTVPVVRP
ncbi:MAG TPA: hypothetical protein VF516_45435 [Kofleriaceae bacterium]